MWRCPWWWRWRLSDATRSSTSDDKLLNIPVILCLFPRRECSPDHTDRPDGPRDHPTRKEEGRDRNDAHDQCADGCAVQHSNWAESQHKQARNPGILPGQAIQLEDWRNKRRVRRGRGSGQTFAGNRTGSYGLSGRHRRPASTAKALHVSRR